MEMQITNKEEDINGNENQSPNLLGNEEEFLTQEIKTNVTEISPITKQYLQSVSHISVEGNQFFINDGRSTVCVTVISDEIIRVRMAPQGVFLVDFSYALSPEEYRISRIDVFENEEIYRISTNTVNCTVQKSNFHISFSDRDDNLINEDEYPMHWEENTEFGGYYIYCTKKSSPEESFFGLGDKPTEFNIRGKRFTLWGTDTYAFAKDQDPLYRNIPFYIGIEKGISYGLFFDNTFKSFFDFGYQESDKVSFWADGGELNYYYIHGPHMMDVVKRYSSLTGRHPMPPIWALGYHQCRWSYFPEKKVKDIASTFRLKKIPCDAIYLDIDYMDGYRCFTWNKKYFPDPKRMIRELKADGFQTVVIIDPGIKVDENYFVYKEAKEKNYFCRRSDDYFMEGHVWPGRCQFPDFTNPEVREWWGDLFKGYIELGVAGIWNDMNEPAVFGLGTMPNDVRHNYDGKRGSHRKAHNVYGMQMVRATYEGLKKGQGKRPFTITRSGYSGVQRYSSVWTGDNVASWEHLRLAGTMCQRLSISGISFCGSDIGGFTGEPDGQLFTRWIQLGVFAPLMRAHSAGDTPEREPWSFGEENEAICRKYIELRYRLLPYFYSAFWEHYKYGFPILRPVVMHEQENLENHARQDEFTFGDKILVFPICEPDCKEASVYLPKGSWYYYWNQSLLEGGTTIIVETPLDILPIFVKAGSELDIQELLLNVYFSEYSVTSFLYEDEGEGYGYENNYFVESKFLVTGNLQSLSIHQTKEGYFSTRYEKYRLKLIGIPFTISKVMIDMREMNPIEDIENGIITFLCDKNFKNIEILA
jgi:alpha-glucosidase